MALGSMGRKEQLFPTDQDNAIIFSDVPDDALDTTRNLLLNMAAQINSQLNELGFAFCPAGMMAKNPQWCLSISEWKQRFSNWIDQPNETGLLHSTIFFDFRGVWGNSNLLQDLTQHLREHLVPHPVFLNYLGIDALKNPKPVGLLNRLKLEPSGSYQGLFDLKGRLLMPYIDTARLLILNSGMEDPKNTLTRFQKLTMAESQNASLYKNAHEAFEFLERLRGIHRSNSNSANGRYLHVKNLTKRQRHTLRYAAKTLHDLQTLLITRFQLSRFL
jgi:CBS domain-containing protein